ncbi:MAG: GGDEF domain-containing protein [Saccharofermentans sp.]|nr:GGDEF domain-containing protein [Saccharofermentans sp.]
MTLEEIKKLTYSINTVILMLVFGLAGFFALCHATFLIWFSIPTAMVYLVGYYLIRTERLAFYVRLVYFWITLYMCITTICLGYRFGFHLYCLSMIPIIFYTEYMAKKLGRQSINTILVSGIIVVCYLISTGYASYAEPVYDIDSKIAGVFWVFNSGVVLFFLIFYSGVMLKMITASENQLTDMAHTDRLTGLYNRHFMITKLETTLKEDKPQFIAMADIDHFKKINDTYGHNTGDYVLENVAKIMKEVCKDCEISRWGGEEFVILSDGEADKDGVALLEKLRKAIESKDFFFEDQHIKVTITAGIASANDHTSVDLWVNDADEKLYFGKNNGRNRVVLINEGAN